MSNDPFPYVGEYGSRHAYPGTLNQKPLTYQARPEYDQTMNTETATFIGWNSEDPSNLCVECSPTGEVDPDHEVTHCENCGLPIEGRRSLWT